jgi:SAM-dependent methyltransferase
VEDRHFWFTARNCMIRAVLAGVKAQVPRRARVLDVGCGTGNTLRVLQEIFGNRAVGMDLFSEALQFARRRTGLPVVQGRGEEAPFIARFDVIGAFDVLEHISDDARTLQRLFELTQSNGWLLLTVPAHQHLWSRFDEESCHVRRYGRSDLRERLEHAGYRVEYLTYLFASIYPAVRFARWLDGRRTPPAAANQSAVRSQLQVVPFVNEVLRLVLTTEAGFVRRRVQIPLGTSLLALARRP